MKSFNQLQMNNTIRKYALDEKRKIATIEHSKSNLDDFISLNIQYVIYNLNKDHQYEFDFGNTIWNIDFDLFNTPGVWEKEFEALIHNRINKRLDYLHDIEVKASISEVISNIKYTKYPVLKYFLDIVLKGYNAKTDQVYYFHTCLFLSPI